MTTIDCRKDKNMKISELTAKNVFKLVNDGGNGDTEITKPFACDLLSFAMSKASSGCAWFTVMGNVNTIAVSVLTECACVVLCEGAELDEAATEKAKQQNVTVYSTSLPVFDAALILYKEL